MKASTATGTLIKNTEPHQKCWRSQPPRRGPAAVPIPPTPAQIPMARARSWPVNIEARMDRVAGMRNAAPSPITARAKMSGPVECTMAQAKEPPPKMTTPTRKMRRRP